MSSIDERENYLQYNLKTVYVHLTHECNLHCKYCYFDAGKALTHELSLDELTLLFKDLVLLSPQKVVFTGGEPLMRTDFFAIAQSFKQVTINRKPQLCLISNGMLINSQTVPEIVSIFDEVRISIDGPKEINDNLRGKGIFEGALNALHCLRNAGIFPSVSITMTANNIPHLSRFLSYLLEEEHVTDFHLSPFRPVGRGTKYPELVCSWSDSRLTVTDFWRRQFGITLEREDKGQSNLVSCGTCGIGNYINIHPNGDVYPCHVLSVPEFLLGNIRQKRLSQIIFESKLLTYLKQLDFKVLAEKNDRIKQVLLNAACVGEVYRDVPDVLSFLFDQ